MTQDNDSYRAQRETFLTILLSVLVGGGLLVFLILITGGLLGYLLLVLAGVAALGFLNYLLWGRAMSRSVAGEREEEELPATDEADDWPLPEPRNPRRL